MAKPAAGRKTTADEEKREFSTNEAKLRFGELLARAGYGDERIIITVRGKARGALVGLRDLAKLEGAA